MPFDFTKEDLDKQVLEALEKRRRATPSLSLIDRLKEAKLKIPKPPRIF